MLMSWLIFAALAAVIAVAGYSLARNGDVIALRTRLSRGWVGLVLMATVTSLPEMVTGVSAVAVTRSPDLAIGGILGSCVFNLALLAVVDFLYRPACMFDKASRGHLMSAGMGSVLLAVAGLGLMIPSPWPNFPIDIGSFLILAVYVFALRSIYAYEQRVGPAVREENAEYRETRSLGRAIAGYLVAAAFVVGAGVMLPDAAVSLAREMGWTDSFAGTLFLAAATSLPELVVVIAAIRLGALNMAVASLLGSNLFNIAIVALTDVAWWQGPLLHEVDRGHTVTVLVALLMNGIVVAALVDQPRGRLVGAISWASLALVGAYALNAWFSYSGVAG